MQQPHGTDEAANPDVRHRKVLVIWAAMLSSLGLYFALAYALREPRAEDATANDTLALVLLCTGAAAVLASFVVKNRLLSRAVGEQNVRLVTTAYIVGLALSEAAGVLGLASSLLFGGGFPDLLFLASAAGMLLHFPRREDFAAASHDIGQGRGITGH
jgi:F0F1-type ATP synthase membrane subunit c/vacuolar-type H+-ATPase subunit K